MRTENRTKKNRLSVYEPPRDDTPSRLLHGCQSWHFDHSAKRQLRSLRVCVGNPPSRPQQQNALFR